MISQVSQSHSLTWTCSKGIPIHPLFRNLSSQTRQLPGLNLIFRRLFVAVSNPKKIATDNMLFREWHSCSDFQHTISSSQNIPKVSLWPIPFWTPPKKNNYQYIPLLFYYYWYSSVFQCKNWCQNSAGLPTTERRRVGSNARSRPSKSAPGIAGGISTDFMLIWSPDFPSYQLPYPRWNFG